MNATGIRQTAGAFQDSTGAHKPKSGYNSSSAQKKSTTGSNNAKSPGANNYAQSKALAAYVKQISDAETQEENIYVSNEELKKELKKNEQSLTQLDAQKTSLKDKIAPLVRTKNGGDTITFKGVQYYIFVADIDTYDIKLHWKDAKGNIYGNIGTLLRSYRDNAPVMITNGGMFNPDISPEGLLIENGVVKAPLNLSRPNNENFYLKPNGTFYISKDGTAHIDTSSEAFNSIIPAIGEATQSGPMLVINGRIHDKFAQASSNKKIRSGVGLISAKKVIFICSKTEANFYDFAVLFRDVFNCQNALFLDGAISLMYLRDLAPDEKGGHFCTLISTTRKKHTK